MQSAPENPVPQVGPGPESQEEILPRQFGKYTLLRALATGGMAQVYLALQRAVAGFEKLVVIKRILPELARDQAFVEMLLSEARTAATLNHPNVVQTFDVGEHEGTYYIAMEHINGEDIRSIVRGMKRKQATEFPLEHTLNIIIGVCAGLAYAHEKKDLEGTGLGIVHRDISPQNILITFTGDVKIVDFGIAKSSEKAVGEKTQAGQLKGKVPYMSPEQAAGEEIDHRSDIFAVGIMLFELTTRRRLFKAKSEYETLKLICDREYPLPSQVRPGYPAQLEQIVMRALTKNRDFRYQNARDMQADLENFVRHHRIAVSAVSLANWMKFLFEEKIAEQKEALQDVKQLADVIATQHSDPGDMFGATATGTSTTGGSTISGTEIGALTAIRQRQRRTYMVLGSIIVGLLAASVSLFLFMRKPVETTKGPAPAVTPPVVEAKKGELEIKTQPPGAYIRIAGELQGAKTPTTLKKLPLGMDIEVKISKEGFEDHVAKVRLTEKKLKDEISVKLLKGSVTLVFEVEPGHARLTLDNKLYKGKGNKIEELSTGEHKAIFTAPGHLPAVRTWVSKKGETKKLVVKLKKGDPSAKSTGPATTTKPPPPKGKGTVSVASSGGYCASTLVNGRNVGPTPVAGISVNAGPVSVVCKTADGRTVGGGGRVEPGKNARIRVRIPKKK